MHGHLPIFYLGSGFLCLTNLSSYRLSIKVVCIGTNARTGIPFLWRLKIAFVIKKLSTSIQNTSFADTLYGEFIHTIFKDKAALPVALHTFSTTFGWSLLFLASFSKYSITLIKIHFDWLFKRFPRKENEFSCGPLGSLLAPKIAL